MQQGKVEQAEVLYKEELDFFQDLDFIYFRTH